NPRTIIVAGDVRAVLASNDAWRGLVATPLSTDHNAKHASEQARLTEKHPNESNVVVCRSPESCRVKGILTEKHPNESNVVVCRSPESCRVKGILQPTR
ncbi:hypothetical protein DYB37_014034, partial [Aphanomyces astaci]